jgi:hypothetical protein
MSLRHACVLDCRASWRYSLYVTDPKQPPQGVITEPKIPETPTSDRSGLLGWIARIPQLTLYSWLYTLPFMGILGILSILVYVSQVRSGVRWSTFGAALAIAAAAGFTGGLVGFLFGIPRAVQGSAPSTGVTDYQANTNLEQVSDWLTKILVGVGLVQIGRVIPALSKFAESMKAPLGGLDSSGAFGLGLTITYAALGFFYLYLWSRSLLARELGIYNTPEQISGTPVGVRGTPQQPSGTPQQPSGTPQQPSGTPQQPSGTPQQPS